MASQVPFAQFGLEEACELFTVQKTEDIMSLWVAQQADTTVEPFVASLWTPMEDPQYPFVGVRAYIPEISPSYFADTEWLDATGEQTGIAGTSLQGMLNDCSLSFHLESKSYRELQRLSSYLWFTIDKDFDQSSGQPWLYTFNTFGIQINGWRQSPVTRGTMESLQRKDEDRNIRTDVERLYQRDITAMCNVQVSIQYQNGIPITYVDFTQNLTIIVQV